LHNNREEEVDEEKLVQKEKLGNAECRKTNIAICNLYYMIGNVEKL